MLKMAGKGRLRLTRLKSRAALLSGNQLLHTCPPCALCVGLAPFAVVLAPFSVRLAPFAVVLAPFAVSLAPFSIGLTAFFSSDWAASSYWADGSTLFFGVVASAFFSFLY